MSSRAQTSAPVQPALVTGLQVVMLALPASSSPASSSPASLTGTTTQLPIDGGAGTVHSSTIFPPPSKVPEVVLPPPLPEAPPPQPAKAARLAPSDPATRRATLCV